MQRLIERWPEMAHGLGLARTTPSGEIVVPKPRRWSSLPGGGFRLRFALPLGITPTDIERSTEALAGAFGGSSAEVRRDPRRANEVDLTLIGTDDPLYGKSRDPAPVLGQQAGRDPLGPVPLGYDSTGELVNVRFFERSILIGGSPGSGKSVAMQSLVAAAALSRDCELWLIDPKGGVELISFWGRCARRTAMTVDEATDLLTELSEVMEARYAALREARQQKVTVGPDTPLIVLVVDELAELTAAHDKKQRETFSGLLRSLVSKGRAAGIVPVLCTQKPSSDVVPTSIRDLIALRVALRCGTTAQAITILGEEAVKQRGADASTIGADTRGLGYLVGEEGGQVRRFRSYFLKTEHMPELAHRAAEYRSACSPRPHPLLAEAAATPQRSDLPPADAPGAHRGGLFTAPPAEIGRAMTAWAEAGGSLTDEWPPGPQPSVVFGCEAHRGQRSFTAVLAAERCAECVGAEQASRTLKQHPHSQGRRVSEEQGHGA